MYFLKFADQSHAPSDVKPPVEPPLDEELFDDEELDTGDELSHMMTVMIPWVISVLLHIGMVLLAFFITWATTNQQEEDPPVVPTAPLLNDAPSEILTYSEKLNTPATTDVPRDVQTQEVAKGDPLSNLTTDTSDQIALIGVAGAKAMPLGSRLGKDKFGVGMYGAGGNAKNVVYVVDASGSLIDTLPFAINELKTSISRLQPIQTFDIIFFQKDGYVEVAEPHKGMKRATPDTIQKVSDWITLENHHIVPSGSSNPVKAIELALSFKPDLIYILSDNITGRGKYAIPQQALLDLIQKRKQEKRTPNTKINTIQFLYPDPLGTLKMIADQNKGVYRFVDEATVGVN